MRHLTIALLLALVALSTGCSSMKHYAHQGQLRHVVMFKFKADATPEQIKAIETHFAQLQHEIPSIKGYEWGTNNSPEGLDKGFTHCFIVTFKDAEGRAAYLPHPAHQKFVEHLKPILDEAMVIDYTVH